MDKPVQIKVKAMSTNAAWKGRRFRTDEYKTYQQICLILLPKTVNIPEGKLQILIRFHVSNEAFDWDNGIKQFQDILGKKYQFNDKRIYRGIGEKVLVPKGEEFIEFQLTAYQPS